MDPDRVLNKTNRRAFKRRLEVSSNGISHIQDAVLKTLYESTNDLEGEFKGYVLQQVSDEPSGFREALETVEDAIRVQFGLEPSVKKYKVRVPQVHNMIPRPTKKKDCLLINMHHTFSETVSTISQVNNDLTAGELVIVRFIDGSGKFNPQIVDRMPSKAPVAFWTDDNPQEAFGEPTIDANITQPEGDAIGSGKKCKNNQVPKIYNKVDESEFANDSVLQWLPLIRGIRRNLESKFGINLSYISDATMLAIIDLESSGRPRVYNGVRHYGLMQQYDGYVFDAYDGGPGAQLIDQPYPASNYAGERRVFVDRLRDRISDNEEVIRDEQQAALWNIQTSFLYFHRYRNHHQQKHLYIANMHHEGAPVQRRVREQQGQLSPIDSIKQYANSINNGRSKKMINYVENLYLPRYNKYIQKLEGYDPNAATIQYEPCEEEQSVEQTEQEADTDNTTEIVLDAEQVLDNIIEMTDSAYEIQINKQEAQMIAAHIVKDGVIIDDYALRIGKYAVGYADNNFQRQIFVETGKPKNKENLLSLIISGQ